MARSQLRPRIAWVGSQIRASGKALHTAAATHASTVLSGMLRSGMPESLAISPCRAGPRPSHVKCSEDGIVVDVVCKRNIV